MFETKVCNNKQIAEKIGEFLTGPNAFDQTWAPNEKTIVSQAPQRSLMNEKHRFWYVEDDGEVIAAMGIRENKYGGGGYIMEDDYFAVHKKYRKQGIATKLLKEVEKFVKSNNGRYIHALSCDIASYAASRAFYLRNGYKKVVEIPNYYVEGEGRVDFFKEID